MSTWETFPSSLVIPGEGISIATMGKIKRKFEELMSITQHTVTLGRTPRRPPLAFYDNEIQDGLKMQ